MAGNYGIQQPEDRLVTRILDLERKLQELATRPFIVPTLGTDPPATSKTNLWYLSDGRLRGRMVDGTIVQYSGTTPGSSTTTTTPPAAQPIPTEHVYESACTWAQSYRLAGTAQRTDAGEFLYYGRISSTHGEQNSMIGWPDLAATLAGSRISEVTLRIVNRWTNFNGGADLRIGLHNSASAPGTFTETVWTPIVRQVEKAGYGETDQTYNLDLSVGEAFRDGSAKGFTFNQRTTDAAFYGYSTRAIVLRIKYITYS